MSFWLWKGEYIMEDIVHFSPIIEEGGPLEWVSAIGIACAVAFLLKTVIHFIAPRWRLMSIRTKWKIDDVLVACFANTRVWAIFIWALYPLSNFIDDEPRAHRLVYVLFVVMTTIQVGIWGAHSVKAWQKEYLAKKISHDAGAASAIHLITTAVNAILILALIMIALSNLGVNIGAMLAGMGIGGVAVALAAQNILGDLFGSLSIVLDKPFVVGDYIVVGNDQGTVENIGIKTTRVRSLTGEELIFSNKDLLESRVKNFKRMWKRRVALKFSVPFDTPLEKIQAVPKWIQEFVASLPILIFERAHLSDIGSSSINFETIFWVNDPDYQKFMDAQQAFLVKMIQRFEDEDIPFAVPVQAFQFTNSFEEFQDQASVNPAEIDKTVASSQASH